ncbi:reverse transcriptase [Penicillium citrinum]|uniref:Reverse transcriptase n=1 Tax=Penicillium citrinum TaxID=5077 RepID=A0A9W9PBS0_PENCI|nr:reverse transcriptase [Penicillium citrinum]KAJ5240343.1 reverse transcriptase [Penicillium citrinum]
MADPHTGGPEPHPTNTQENITNVVEDDHEAQAVTDTSCLLNERRKRTRSSDAFTPSDPASRITTREVWKLVSSLKEVIRRQTAVIETTQNELQEIKHSQNVLQEQNEKLHEEVKALRAQVESAPVAAATRTWAAVAANGRNTTPSLNHRQSEKEQNCIRISTQRTVVDPRDNDNSDGNVFGRYLPTDAVNNHIRTALQSDAATQEAQVAGIGTTKTGYLIRFQDTESAEVARNNSGWIQKLGNNTKLVKPRFGVVVFPPPTAEQIIQAAVKIIEENDLAKHGFRIEELAWMKAKDKVLGKFASLGIWFDSAEGAEYMLRSGFLVNQHYIPYVERREIKKKRCFRCQRFGHLAWSCKETPRCGHCAGQHERERCPPGPSDPRLYQMLETNLRILQLNMMKSAPRMEALINDHQNQDLDILLIQEPSITTYHTHVNHSAWRLYRPTTKTDATRFRSLIYVNRRISTSSHRQIPCDHPDVAAIKIWTAESQTLFFSIYIPPAPIFATDDTSAIPTLTAIENTITATTQTGHRTTNIIIAGDFNRHHPMWGGNNIPPRFIEHASDLITFFQTHNLSSCLPRGTATYWALNNPGQNSTIDQTVTDRPDLLIKCQLYHENYGSDHRATYSEWNLQAQSRPSLKARKLYDRADWARIGEEVTRQMSPWKEIKTRPTLDRVVESLTAAMAQAVGRFTPDTRPTPYSKRWFTPDLKVQQVEVNQLRRRWQASCAERGRDHASTTATFQAMQKKRRAWTRTIEKAKATHWRRFLDEAGEGKLWKAATYMKPREAWGCVPALRVGSEELIENKDKAQAFLEAFFPAMNTPDPSPPAAKRGVHLQGHITFNGTDIKPSPTAKLLGVVFDQGLRWKEHIQQAIKRATKTTLALSGLRHLRPEQMRQLYQACVAPIGQVHLRHLNTVQRTVLIRILSAFRTVATATLEIEAHILPTHLRLRYRAQRTIARLHTLPRDHPIWNALSRARNRRNNVGSYARFPLAEALKTMNVDRLNELETIDPRPLPPWRVDPFTEIEIGHDRETARERAETVRNATDIVVYSDASGREGHLGAAVVTLNDDDEATESQQIQVGPMDRWSVHVAELIGIFYAVNMVYKLAHQCSSTENSIHTTATILCDSRSALQAIQNVKNKSGQPIVHAILRAASEVQAKHITLRLQWTPGHCENAGNDTADRLAKDAAQPGKSHTFRPLLARENAFIRDRIHAQWRQEWKSSIKGLHLRRIDDTLPARYTRKLYGNLPRNRAYLLTQLRTGHNWLSTYAKKFGFRDDDLCECGARETVSHVLLVCPKLRGLRVELRSKLEGALNSIPSLLGGSTEGEKGNPDIVSRSKAVQAVLDFAEASQRFRSRAPRGQPNNGNGNGPR